MKGVIVRVNALAGMMLILGLNAVLAAEPVQIHKTAEPVTIDGSLEEPCWRAAAKSRTDYVNGQTGKLSDAPRMAVMYAWDDQYLYIGYETFDANLVAVSNGEKQGPKGSEREGCLIWGDPGKIDVVEFFITPADERFFWEIHHNAANQFNDIWCTNLDPEWPVSKSALFPFGIIFDNAAYLPDEGKLTVAAAARPQPGKGGKPSTINSDKDKDTGYTAELRLPWHSLGADKSLRSIAKSGETGESIPAWNMKGRTLRILAVVQDGDLETRYHHSGPEFPGGWFHKGVAHWPVLECAE